MATLWEEAVREEAVERWVWAFVRVERREERRGRGGGVDGVRVGGE